MEPVERASRAANDCRPGHSAPYFRIVAKVLLRQNYPQPYCRRDFSKVERSAFVPFAKGLALPNTIPALLLVKPAVVALPTLSCLWRFLTIP